MTEIKKVWNVTLMHYPHTLFAIPENSLKRRRHQRWQLSFK